MKKVEKWIYMAVIAAGVLVIFAVSWHSLEEIHYLKTFYPPRFTVREAFYASAVELVKDMVVALPFVVAIWVSISLLRKRKRD